MDNDNEDVPYFWTDGKQKMTLDADLASTEKQQKRAARFAGPSGGSGSAAPRKKHLNLMASINTTLLSGTERIQLTYIDGSSAGGRINGSLVVPQ